MSSSNHHQQHHHHHRFNYQDNIDSAIIRVERNTKSSSPVLKTTTTRTATPTATPTASNHAHTATLMADYHRETHSLDTAWYSATPRSLKSTVTTATTTATATATTASPPPPPPLSWYPNTTPLKQHRRDIVVVDSGTINCNGQDEEAEEKEAPAAQSPTSVMIMSSSEWQLSHAPPAQHAATQTKQQQQQPSLQMPPVSHDNRIVPPPTTTTTTTTTTSTRASTAFSTTSSSFPSRLQLKHDHNDDHDNQDDNNDEYDDGLLFPTYQPWSQQHCAFANPLVPATAAATTTNVMEGHSFYQSILAATTTTTTTNDHHHHYNHNYDVYNNNNNNNNPQQDNHENMLEHDVEKEKVEKLLLPTDDAETCLLDEVVLDHVSLKSWDDTIPYDDTSFNSFETAKEEEEDEDSKDGYHNCNDDHHHLLKNPLDFMTDVDFGVKEEDTNQPAVMRNSKGIAAPNMRNTAVIASPPPQQQAQAQVVLRHCIKHSSPEESKYGGEYAYHFYDGVVECWEDINDDGPMILKRTNVTKAVAMTQERRGLRRRRCQAPTPPASAAAAASAFPRITRVKRRRRNSSSGGGSGRHILDYHDYDDEEYDDEEEDDDDDDEEYDDDDYECEDEYGHRHHEHQVCKQPAKVKKEHQHETVPYQVAANHHNNRLAATKDAEVAETAKAEVVTAEAEAADDEEWQQFVAKMEYAFPVRLQIVYRSARARLNAGKIGSAILYCQKELRNLYQQAETAMTELGKRPMLEPALSPPTPTHEHGNNNNNNINKQQQERRVFDLRQQLAGMWCVYAHILMEVRQTFMSSNSRNGTELEDSHRKPVAWHEERRMFERYLSNTKDPQLPSMVHNMWNPATSWTDFFHFILGVLFEVRRCPLVGNHSWLCITLARMLSETSVTATGEPPNDQEQRPQALARQQSGLRHAILVCHDAVDSASPPNWNDSTVVVSKPRFSWDKTSSVTLEQFLLRHGCPITTSMTDQNSSVAFSATSLISKLQPLCSTGYLFRDLTSAQEMCLEVNRLSRMEERIKRICKGEPAPPPPKLQNISWHAIDYLTFFRVVDLSRLWPLYGREKAIDNTNAKAAGLAKLDIQSCLQKYGQIPKRRGLEEFRARQEVNACSSDAVIELDDGSLECYDFLSDDGGGYVEDDTNSTATNPIWQPCGLVVDMEYACRKCFQSGFKTENEQASHQRECHDYRWLSNAEKVAMEEKYSTAASIKQTPLPEQREYHDYRWSSNTEKVAMEEEHSTAVSTKQTPLPEEDAEIFDFLLDLVTVTRNARCLIETYAKSFLPVMPSLGQVGLRCRFCKSWALRGSFVFPQSCADLPKALRRLCLQYFDTCRTMPREERAVYDEFRAQFARNEKAFVDYWGANGAMDQMLYTRRQRGRSGVFWTPYNTLTKPPTKKKQQQKDARQRSLPRN